MTTTRSNIVAYNADKWAFIHWQYIRGVPDESCIIRYMYSNNKRYYELLDKVEAGVKHVSTGNTTRERFITDCKELVGTMQYALKRANKAHEAIYNVASIVRLNDLIYRMERGDDVLEAWQPYAVDKTCASRYQFPEAFVEREAGLKDVQGKEIIKLFQSWLEPQKKDSFFSSYHHAPDLSEFYDAKRIYSHLNALALPMQYVGEIFLCLVKHKNLNINNLIEVLTKFPKEQQLSIVCGILNPSDNQNLNAAYHILIEMHRHIALIPGFEKEIFKEQKFLQYFAEMNPEGFFQSFLPKLSMDDNRRADQVEYFEGLLLSGFQYQKHIKSLLRWCDIKHPYVSYVLYEALASGDSESAKELVDAIRQYSISRTNATLKYKSDDNSLYRQEKVVSEKTEFQETISFVLKDFIGYLKKKYDRARIKESVFFVEFADQFVNDLVDLNLITEPATFKQNIDKLYTVSINATFEENRQLKSRVVVLESELEKAQAEIAELKRLYQASLNDNAIPSEPKKSFRLF